MRPVLFFSPHFLEQSSFCACQNKPKSKKWSKWFFFTYLFFWKCLLWLEFIATRTTNQWQKITPCSNGDFYTSITESVCRAFLHVQSSHRGSFRKAGVFFRKDTVRVTSSPAFLKTWTWKVKKNVRNIFIARAVNCEVFLPVACCDETCCANV